MNRMDVPKDRLAAFVAALENVLQDAKISLEDRERLVELAVEESLPALKNADAKPLESAPECFGALMKQVRLSGELPTYLATIIALWFSERGVKPDEIKSEVGKSCGLHFEREALALIADKQLALPDLGLDERSRKKTELMKLAHRKGFERERLYGGCAQCTLASVSDITHETNDGMFRAANAFAGGMASMGDGACGGYSGGLMSLGMFAGRRREFFDGDLEEKALLGEMSRELRKKFTEAYGTVICHGIHKEIFGRAFNITIPEEKEAFELAGGHSLDKCTSVVGMSSAWTVDILFERGFIE